MKPLFAALAGATLLLAVAGCRQESEAPPQPDETKQEAPAMSSITGTVSYRERMMLSPQASVEISLLDVSKADTAADVIATRTIAPAGQVPIPFDLKFDPSRIDERMSYSVSARIMDGGRLQFISDTHNPVLTRGAGNHLDIMLRRVAAPTPVQSSQPVVHGQELKGSFRYMADAALFEDCRSGKSFPVAMEGAYIELERAYLDSSVEPPDPLLVTIRGRMLERPGMEEGTREVHVIVDEFLGVSEDSDCTPNREASLENTRWKLVELGEGRRLAPGDTVTGAFFILRTGQGQVNGSGGCNNFFGSYEVDGDKLVFGALGNTMKMCPTGMDIEQAMMQALGETTRYAINGEVLSLYADDRVLARFEAEYL